MADQAFQKTIEMVEKIAGGPVSGFSRLSEDPETGTTGECRLCYLGTGHMNEKRLVFRVDTGLRKHNQTGDIRRAAPVTCHLWVYTGCRPSFKPVGVFPPIRVQEEGQDLEDALAPQVFLLETLIGTYATLCPQCHSGMRIIVADDSIFWECHYGNDCHRPIERGQCRNLSSATEKMLRMHGFKTLEGDRQMKLWQEYCSFYDNTAKKY